MTQIKFVYFDLGNILVSFDPQIACQNIANLFGVTTKQAETAVYDSGLEDRYEHGQISADDFHNQVQRELGPHQAETKHVPRQAFLDALGDMFSPIESTQQTIQQVQQAGLPIGILSNTCFAHWDWVVRQKWPVLQGPFDVTVLSYEVGAMKPDEKIYVAAEQAAHQAAGVSPNEILFVDDRQENVDAAIQRGWNAAQCFGGVDLDDQLKRFGVIS